jgi:hypothetical protein
MRRWIPGLHLNQRGVKDKGTTSKDYSLIAWIGFYDSRWELHYEVRPRVNC